MGDKGLNVRRNVGTFSPSPFYTKKIDDTVGNISIKKTVDAMRAEGREFKGIIFYGLMLTKAV